MADGDWMAARDLHDRLMPLHEAVFTEPGLVGAKYALSLLGRCQDEVRLPLVPLTEGTRLVMKSTMERLGLIG